MAETKKFLDLVGLGEYDAKIKEKVATDDATTLQSAKTYADGLAVNYDPAGTATTKVNELKNGAVKTNTTNITALQGKVATLESTKYTPITKAEIDALFTAQA